MKRLVSAALALSLIGSTAAVADPYGHGRWGGYSHQDRGDFRRGDNGAGLAIGLGVGLLALGAIAASQHHERDYNRYDNRGYGYGGGSYYDQGGYAPSYGGGYGSANGYGGGYGSAYGNSGYRHGFDNYRYGRQDDSNYNYGDYGR
jgi:hypothetical protein